MEAYKTGRNTCNLLCCLKGDSAQATALPGVDYSFHQAYINSLGSPRIENVGWSKPDVRVQKRKSK